MHKECEMPDIDRSDFECLQPGEKIDRLISLADKMTGRGFFQMAALYLQEAQIYATQQNTDAVARLYYK
jgi:HJR/Mrr/RecB family endonuclease